MTKRILAVIALAAVIGCGAQAQEVIGRAGGNPVKNAGAPSNGTNEIQTLTFGASTTTGNFKLTFGTKTTGNIAWSATNNTLRDNVDAAIEALTNVGTGGVTTAVDTMTAGIGTLTVTFTGNNAHLNVPQMTVNTQTTGGTLAVTTTTAGVDATARKSEKGALLVDTSAGDLYINQGVPLSPTWLQVNP